MKVRHMSVGGTFYPNSCEELTKYIDHFNEQITMVPSHIKNPRAIIVPHAGYIYSGFTANLAYSKLLEHAPKRIVVIGPSHKIFLEGASIALYDKYQTPFGKLNMDLEYSSKLKKQFSCLCFNPFAHAEHSTETQMPFIKKYFPQTTVVEIVYGNIKFNKLASIISEIMLESDNYMVISTDLSHFYSQKDANLLDSVCLNAIENLDAEMLNHGCEACGMIGIEAIITWAVNNGYKSELLDYRTSMNVNGDANRVVGYMSAIIGE